MKIRIGKRNVRDEYDDFKCAGCGEIIDEGLIATWVDVKNPTNFESREVPVCESCYENILENIRDSIFEEATYLGCDNCGGQAKYLYDGDYYCETCLTEAINDEANDVFERYPEDYLDNIRDAIAFLEGDYDED